MNWLSEWVDIGTNAKALGSDLTLAGLEVSSIKANTSLHKKIIVGGKTGATADRPVQLVNLYVSDGSTINSDAQILASTANLTLEFNGTVEDVPVYTEAQQTFTLASGATLASNAAGVTLFQF